MKTVKIAPRGYCHGVVNAINTITNLNELSTETPIYILGMVIHNKGIVDSFSNMGFITLYDKHKTRLQLLDEIDKGTVIFTAHGVSPEVYAKAINKGLTIIDTTCKDVSYSHKVVKDYIMKDYCVIYVGIHKHPESESVKGISNKVHVIENIDDLKRLKLTSKKIALTNQTTMSIFDIYNIFEEAKKIYKDIVIVDEICNSTRIRQEAVLNQDKNVDHCFIVGDKLSNNSNKLKEVSINQASIDSSLIESIEDIDIEKLKTFNSVSISSGASTPTRVTNEVIEFLEKFDKNDKMTHSNKSKLDLKNLLKKHSKLN